MRIHASALNYRDLIVMANAYPSGTTEKGYVPLCDAAGEVVRIGSGAGLFKVGDRVSPIASRQWLHGTRYPRRIDAPPSTDGMLADYAVVHESALVDVPDHLDWAEAASLSCAGMTAWSALFKEAGWIPGMSILTQGSGGVSLFALQFAKIAGARVIATSSTPSKLERLKALGADVVINYRETPDWDRAVLDATDGLGVDLVIEVGGAGTLERSLGCTRPDGQISVVGMLSTIIGGQVPAVELTAVRQKRLRLQALWTGSRESQEEMNHAIAVHALRPVIDQVFPFEDARAAFEHLRSGGHFGKIVIRHDRS
jgi:NADPH:quinone reductase-like Zn-dependent oxidoreductase